MAGPALDALMTLLSPEGLMYCFLGTMLALFFGMMPGLGGSAAVALLLPITFGWEPGNAFILISSAVGGVTFGGAITAILINTPGTAPNAATLLDGYPLAQKGRASFAIGIAGTASAAGAIVGVIMFILVMPFARALLLSFSYPEVFLAAVIGLISIAFVSRGGIHRGIIAGGLGFLMSFVGVSVITGERRFTFGSIVMMDGFSLVPVVVGLFAISEAIMLLVNGRQVSPVSGQKIGMRENWREVGRGFRFTFKNPRIFLMSSIIGWIVGVIPAVGGSVASFIAYSTAQSTSKNSENFGKGDPRGVLASEAANDAKDGGAMLPTVAFGIPGSAVWAVVLGAFLIHGLIPGRQLMTDGIYVLWVMIWSLILSDIITSAVGMSLAPFLGIITRIRAKYVGPGIIGIAVIGAYAFRSRVSDVVIASAVGTFAYFVRKYGFGLIPIVIGLVLGTQVELALAQVVSSMGLSAFWERPISRWIIIIGGLLLLSQAVKAYQVHRRRLGRQRPQPLTVGAVGPPDSNGDPGDASAHEDKTGGRA